MNMGVGKQSSRALRCLAALGVACLVALPAVAQRSQWIRFHDPQTGLSFRYPPDLHVRRRDPRKFGLPNMETILDLIGNTKLNPGTVVLRFLVRRGNVSSGEAAKRREELRRVCTKTSPMMVGGHRAMVCVSKGRAAIHWSIEILEPRQCTILTLLGGADYRQSLPPPHNGEFPLLSIIRTVHFAPAHSTRIH